MQRRFKLGDKIASTEQTPSLTISEDGKRMIFTFPIISTETPDTEPFERDNSKRHTHRDLFEPVGGTIYSSGLKASLTSAGASGETVLNLTMRLNSKVPGTGTAFALEASSTNGNGHHS
jgi:hypothetical protein